MALSTGTILLIVSFAAIIFFILGRFFAERSFAKRLKEERKDATTRSRAVIGGQFSEQLAPFLPGFAYKPTEVKFLGKPSDFLVFEGLDEKKITRVVFVEVKSGNATLSSTEKSLQETINAGKVSFDVYHIPQELTKKERSAEDSTRGESHA